MTFHPNFYLIFFFIIRRDAWEGTQEKIQFFIIIFPAKLFLPIILIQYSKNYLLKDIISVFVLLKNYSMYKIIKNMKNRRSRKRTLINLVLKFLYINLMQ